MTGTMAILSFWRHLCWFYSSTFSNWTCRFLRLYWQSIVIVVTPIALLPIVLFNDTPANRCLYVLFLVTIFWCCQALPLPVTSMLPIVLFPILGIMSTEDTCMLYLNETSMHFLGVFIFALAIEYCNLHKRVALKLILIIGCSQRKLNFGLISVTMFVSMWVSNSATIGVMVPVIKAVLERIEEEGIFQMYVDEDSVNTNPQETNPNQINHKKKKHSEGKPSKITLCYFMGAAYVTSIGSCGSIQGSGENLAFQNIYESRFKPQKLGFLDWMYFNVPIMLINTVATYVYLQWYFMGMFRPNSADAKAYRLGKKGEQIVHQVIVKRYNELGTITQHEIQVAILFTISTAMYFVRSLGSDGAIGSMQGYISDATPAVLAVIALFVLPSKWEWVNFFRANPEHFPKSNTPSLITWNYVNANLPWALLFLLGGGFALAAGGKASGMSSMLGAYLSIFEHLPLLLQLFFICFFIQIITEFVSSVAIANVILPVLAEVAVRTKVHPLYLMYPATLSCSMGFHTIFGTPHNGVAAEIAKISMRDMALAGIGPSLFSLLTIWLAIPTWGLVIYPDLASFPIWAANSSTTN